MLEPISIPLSEHQGKRLDAFAADAKALNTAGETLNARLNDTVTAIIAGHINPDTVKGWTIRQEGATIVCTPPAKPALVPDIGPAGVSESAAAG